MDCFFFLQAQFRNSAVGERDFHGKCIIRHFFASNNRNKSLFTEQLRKGENVLLYSGQLSVFLAGCCATHHFSLISYIFFTPKTEDREHRTGLSFGTLRSPLFLTLEIYTHVSFPFPPFFILVSFFPIRCGALCWCVCWGQGYENKSPPPSLSQVMCLFSWTHLLVYCVVAFLPSYRLALVGHFSPSNPVHHILVLESVKWVLEKRGHNVCLCCCWTQMGLVLFFPPLFLSREMHKWKFLTPQRRLGLCGATLEKADSLLRRQTHWVLQDKELEEQNQWGHHSALGTRHAHAHI